MLEPVVHPGPVRALNRAGALLRSAGLPLIRLTPGSLKARAVRMAGLRDFGDSDFEEPLEVLCDSAETDARLLISGRMVFRDQITDALITRLRRIEARRTRPAVFKAPLVPPLIVLGLPRSGTTLLHRLLSLAGNTYSPPLWELRMPIPGPGPDRRRAETIAMVARMKKAAPDLDAKHHVDPDEPEEDVILHNSSFSSLFFWMMFPVYSYLDWFLARDQGPSYRVYREHLQLLQAANPGKRLILKAPNHAGHLRELLEAVPEALLVQTHRDPVTVTSSVNSLFYTVHGYATESVDVIRMGRTNLNLLAEFLDRNLAARPGIPQGRLIDVRYGDLTADSLAIVGRIFKHFGLAFEGPFETRVKDWLARRPQHKFGKHEYAAADFGLTDEMIAARFREYSARFLDG